MLQELEEGINVGVVPICTVCQFYGVDYMDCGEYGRLKGEFCHNKDGKYSYQSHRILDEVKKCDGFKVNIEYTLKNIEREYDITILYAVENGSRVWGFSNEDSDFDIRFIYKHNDIKEYLHVNNDYEDVMQFHDGIYDIVGWDVKKALYLHSKNNPSLNEWINSREVYVNKIDNIFKELPKINRKSLLHHYYNMSKKHWNKYCKDWKSKEDDYYDLSKKFLYIVRCILTWNLIYRDKSCFTLDIYQLIGSNMDINEITENVEDRIIWICDTYKYNSKKDSQLDSCRIGYYESYIILEGWIKSSLFFMKEATMKYKNEERNDYNSYNKVLYELLDL